MANIPEKIETKICVHCHSHLKQNKWVDIGLSREEVVRKVILDKISFNPKVKNPKTEIDIIQRKGTLYKCLVKIKGEVFGKKLQKEYYCNVHLRNSVCTYCSRRASGYYEAVIQLRADKRDLKNKEIKKIEKIISNTLESLWPKNRLAYVSKISKLKEGVDYYIGSYTAARKIVSAIMNNFGGIIDESSRVVGRDKSKGREICRYWILLKLPFIEEKDIIEYKNKIGQVKSIDGRGILVKIFDNNKHEKIPWKEYDKIKLKAKHSEIETTTVVSKSLDKIQILDPKTFQPIDLDMKSWFQNLNIGDEVKVIKINKRIYIVD